MPLKSVRLGARVLLALGSFVVFGGLLEIAARVVWGHDWIRRERGGVYASTLPLVSSQAPRVSDDPTGEPLPFEKAPGEVRVFVMGESSIEGLPWGHHASPPTMLYDVLTSRVPDRRVTVVNMGRAAARSVDAFYYLLALADYDPDVIIFYMGANDDYLAGDEPCAPVEWSGLHAAWRWAVSRSHLLFVTRVLASRLAAGARTSPRPIHDTPTCDERAAFTAWTDVLLSTAAATGAHVIVASPVENWIVRPDSLSRSPNETGAPLDALAATRGPYREAIVRLLQEPPDYAGASALFACGDRKCAASTKGAAPNGWSHGPAGIVRRGLIWEQQARAHGAEFVDSGRALADLAPGRRMGPPVIVDDCHLSVEGYLALATLLAPAVEAALGGGAEVREASREPPDASAYRRPRDVDVLANSARLSFESRCFLAAAAVGAMADQAGDESARVLQEAMRRRLGLSD